MAEQTVEKKSRVILGVMSALLLAVFIAFSLGSQTWMRVLMIITGLLISLLLFSESAIITYVKSGQYKKFSVGDVVVWLTVIVATVIAFNSLFAIPTIGQIVPISILNFTSGVSVIVGIVGIILSLIHIFTPRFK